MRTEGTELVLIGGGHAHLGVLAEWARRGPPDARLTLLTPDPATRYSGMVPGTLAGEYGTDTGLIDLAALCGKAGVRLELGRCAALEPDLGQIVTESGERLRYDYCSIDCGGTGQAERELGRDPRLIDVRPISTFLQRFDRLGREVGGSPAHTVVVGGGAAGVEIAFALRRRPDHANASITLVAGQAGLLASLSARARTLTRREMERKGIALIEADARVENGALHAGARSLEPAGIIIASLGAAAPDWPAASGLAVDDGGFIAVDRHQRSVSHPNILAAGDIASRQDRHVPRSGVHAVHTGPVLARNLRHLAGDGGPLQSYRPRPASLYLLSVDERHAIASYGPLAAQGRWAALLKRWIDTGWTGTFAKM